MFKNQWLNKLSGLSLNISVDFDSSVWSKLQVPDSLK